MPDLVKAITSEGRTVLVYGVENPTFAITVIIMCSLRLNFPGLRLHVCPKVVNRLDGRTASRSFPAGKASS